MSDPETDQGSEGGAVRIAHALLVILFAFFVAIAVTTPTLRLLETIGVVAAETSGWELARTAVQFSAFLAAVVVYLSLIDDLELLRVRLPDRFETGAIVGGIIVLLVVQFAVAYGFAQLGVTTGQNRALLPGREDPTYFLYMVAVSILFVGPAEEVLFRGAVQGQLRRAMDAAPAIAVASVLFGLMHVFAVQGSTGEVLLYAVVAILLGVILGYLYEWSGNLAVPSLVHGCYNGTLFALQYAAAVGVW